MKKVILTIIISFLCVLWISFADDVKKYDCNIATIDDDGNYRFLPNQYSHILPDDAMSKVYENLRFSCCKMWSLTDKQCKNYDSNAIFPDSRYLFDHLLDVYMRRLDAKQEDDNWWNLLYGLAPDPVWLEWREFMSEIANNSEGTPPTIINEKYRKFWKWSIFFEKYSGIDIQTETNRWLNNIESKAQTYGDRSLADRYNNACNIIMMMYLKIINPVNNSSWIELYGNTSTIQSKLLSIYNSCTELVNDRLNAERSYTEAIMQQKWNVFLDDTLNAYLNTYFIENKMSDLRDKIFNRCAMFKEVVKSVSKLVKNCS